MKAACPVRAVFVMAIAVFAPTLRAQNGAATQAPVQELLTMSTAIEEAGRRYPAVLAALEQQQAARAQIDVARTAYLPRADMLWQLNRATTNKANLTPFGQPIVPIPTEPAREATGHSDWNTLTGVLFSWQPFDFGVRRAQVDISRSGYESTRRAADLTKLDVQSAAASAFFDVVVARQLVKVQQANLERMQTFSHSIHVLVDNTLRPGADASQADAQLAQARTQLIQAETQARVRLEALGNFLQVASDQIQIDDATLLAEPPLTGNADASIESHPVVARQTALRDQATNQLHLLNRSWVPALSLYGSVSGLGAGLTSTPVPRFQGGTAGLAPQTYNWLAAAQVTFPAFQFFTLRPEKKVQQAQVNAAEATRRRILGDVSMQVKQARAMLDGARSIAKNTPIELDAARQSETQQRARYQSGLATVIEVSAAESTLAQAEADDALARINVWRGLASVAEAQGDLTPFLKLLGSRP